MQTRNPNPYTAPRSDSEVLQRATKTWRRALALRAFLYSATALCMSILVPAGIFLLVQDKIWGGRATLEIIGIGIYAVMFSGLAAAIIALACGTMSIRVGSLLLALIYLAMFNTYLTHLSVLLHSAISWLHKP